MTDFFRTLLEMSLRASLVAGVVLLLRLVLKRAPKALHAALWALVAVSLICPFAPESALSLMPEAVSSGQALESWTEGYVGPSRIYHEGNPGFQTALEAGRLPSVTDGGDRYVVTGENFSQPRTVGAVWLPLLAKIWLAGALFLGCYALITYWKLRKDMETAVLLRDNIYQTDRAASPFVLGLLKPRIYLPFSLREEDRAPVLAHEQAHIARRDYWWKPLGFALLALHWFNPLMWLCCGLFCKDIELACDERVIAGLDRQGRADYSQALLRCAVHRRAMAACPLAFGEVGVKARVKNILSYRRPTFWMILAAVVLIIFAAVCFLTAPESRGSMLAEGKLYHQSDWEGDIPAGSQEIGRVQRYQRSGEPTGDFDLRGLPGKYRNLEGLPVFEGPDGALYIPHSRGVLRLERERGRGPTPGPQLWVENSQSDAQPLEMEEFPGVTFCCDGGKVWAENGSGNTILFSAMPLGSVYLADLNGDGRRELCADGFFGSGLIDRRIYVADYANGISAELADRGAYDYVLGLENGVLYARQYPYPYGANPTASAVGRLTLEGDRPALIPDENCAPGPMLMAGETLYIATGRVSQEAGCGVMDGTVTARLAAGAMPTREGEGHFPEGTGWQYGSDGCLELNLEGGWHRLEPYQRFLDRAAARDALRAVMRTADARGRFDGADPAAQAFRAGGDKSLRYLYELFLQGGLSASQQETCWQLMDELLGSEALELVSPGGQDYFEAFLAHNRRLLRRNSWEFMEENLPKGALLLRMAGPGPAALPDDGAARQNPDSSASRQALREVLLDQKPFFEAGLGETITLDTLRRSFTSDPSVRAAVSRFSVLDLDGDGLEEAILMLTVGENEQFGCEILRGAEGRVCGYFLPYRSFSGLKADGTFSFSSGAGNSGFGRLRFTARGCETERITFCETDYRETQARVTFTVQGRESSRAEFDRALEAQSGKRDAEDWPYSEKNVEARLAQ